MKEDSGNIFLNAVTRFVECQNEQDIPGILRLMHKESFAYKTIQRIFLKLFATFQLQTTLLDKVFIAREGDFAYVRIRLRIEKLDGPDFENNITEFLVVFRNIGSTWKIWLQQPLTYHLL